MGEGQRRFPDPGNGVGHKHFRPDELKSLDIYSAELPDVGPVGERRSAAVGAGGDARSQASDPGPSVPRYRATRDGLIHVRGSAAAPDKSFLTNFTATIVANIVEDDGAEERRRFEIAAALGDRNCTFQVDALTFGSMMWAAEHLGSGAVVYPGSRDHARVAIQILSGSAPERYVFAHTGWRTINDAEVYLHAGGALGPDGPIEGIQVVLQAPLDRFVLPDPPVGETLRQAIRASLRLLDLGPDFIGFSLLAAIYRAALGESDLAVHLTGPTGVFKTELAALVQAHWGSGLDARHLPGSWSSTANANEDLAFMAKDAVLVVDDFAPGGSPMDVGRLHRDADRLLRAQGNRSGRARMRPDTSLRAPRPPRGLILSTGEEVPHGASLAARIVVVEVAPGDVDVERLTACQADAAAGRFAAAMAGFVKWLAGRGPDGRLQLRTWQLDSTLVAPGGHRQVARNLKSLLAGVAAFLAFAQDSGAVDVDERERFLTGAVAAFRTLDRAQLAQQTASDPVRRFLELLASALVSGRAHVAAPSGQAPRTPEAWGWRNTGAASGGAWHAQGSRVGWLDGDDLYLDPAAAFAAAQAMGNAMGDVIATTPRALHKRLHEAGLLRSTETGRDHLVVRRVLERSRRAVLHLAASLVQEPDQTAQLDRQHAARTPSGPVDGATDRTDHGTTGPRNEAEIGPRRAHAAMRRTRRAGWDRWASRGRRKDASGAA